MFDFSKYNLQELQAMSDLLDYLREDAGADALSYFCGCSLLQEIKRESLRLSRSILMSLEEQARAFTAHDAAGDPPASNLPAEGPEGLQVVDTLSRCSNRLAALAAAEDKHFAECSQTEVFNKVTMLRECKQALNNMVSDIRDHYDGLH